MSTALLGEEHEAIRALVRDFGREQVRPRIAELEAAGEFPRELYRQMGELGFFGCVFPEEHGGTDIGFRALAVVAEELAYAYPPLSAGMNLQAATVPLTILRYGTPEQVKRYVPGPDRRRAPRLQRHDRARRRLGLPGRDAHRAQSAGATATCSTARRCSSPTPTSPTPAWSTPRPTRRPSTRASRRSSSRPPPRACRCSACRARCWARSCPRRRWRSRTARSAPTRSWAPRARASRSRCARWTSVG